MPQTMYWSQTESSKWSLDSLSHDLGPPFKVENLGSPFLRALCLVHCRLPGLSPSPPPYTVCRREDR